MAYWIEAFIFKQADTSLFINYFDKAVKIDIGQGLDLIPRTDELFEQINKSPSFELLDAFEYFTANMEQEVLKVMGNKKFAYVEALYHGGDGGQIAIIWNNNKREKFLDFGQDKINEVLKDFGVVARRGQDEFVTMGFAMRRSTEDWFDETINNVDEL